MRLLLKRRRCRREDARRLADETTRKRRNDWFSERHKRRRTEADENIEQLAWFNVTYLFANLKRRGLVCTMPRADVIARSQQPCYYCGISRSGGIDRIDSLGNYTAENIVAACKMCNYMKGGMHAHHFLAYCVSAAKQEKMTVTARGIWSSYTKSRTSARDRNREFSLTKEEYDNIISQNCCRCGLENCRGVDRKDNSIGYTLENSRPMCFVCNYIKGQHSDAELIEQLKKIAALHSDHATTFTGRSRFTSAVWKFVEGEEAVLCGKESD